MLTNTPIAFTGNTTHVVTTIDDCLFQARQLMSTLSRLAQQKYPLSVRKGSVLRIDRKEVETMAETATSRIVKAGSKTYFFDVKQTKEGKPYLVITESRFQGDEKTRQRVRLTVFPEQVKEFVQALTEIAAKVV